jgi:hypothetical protein
MSDADTQVVASAVPAVAGMQWLVEVGHDVHKPTQGFESPFWIAAGGEIRRGAIDLCHSARTTRTVTRGVVMAG